MRFFAEFILSLRFFATLRMTSEWFRMTSEWFRMTSEWFRMTGEGFEVSNMPNNQQSKESSVWYALSLAWQLGYTIAIPIVVLALVGRLLDRKFGTSPWLLLAGILVSIIVSSVLIYKKVIKILNKQ